MYVYQQTRPAGVTRKRCAPPALGQYRFARSASRSPRRALGDCASHPSIVKAGITTGAAIGVSFIPVVGPIIAGIVGLVGAFIPETSSCAKHSPDPETFLACWRPNNPEEVPNGFIPEWDSDKCGWWRWVKCPGAIHGHYPAAGCGPCTPGDTAGMTQQEISKAGAANQTCWMGTEIAPGVPAWGQSDSSATPGATGLVDLSSVGAALATINPLWIVGASGIVLLLLRRRSQA